LSSDLLKLLMKSCQATICTPLKVGQKWARFIRKDKLCKFIENTLKIDYNGRNFNIVEKGECGEPVESVVRTSMTQFVFSWNTVGFTKCKVQNVVNLFEDTGSVHT
jgi:hypothetical protein